MLVTLKPTIVSDIVEYLLIIGTREPVQHKLLTTQTQTILNCKTMPTESSAGYCRGILKWPMSNFAKLKDMPYLKLSKLCWNKIVNSK